MFKIFALCFLAVFAVAAAKPGLLAYSAYTSPYVAAAPYTAAAYTAASPYYASYAAAPYVAAPYAAAYSAYPYSAAYLLRK